MAADYDPFLITFAGVMFLALIIPELVHRFNITPVPFYIIAGIIVGPYGVGLLELNPSMYDIGRMGLFFLVFLAGLEAHYPAGKKSMELMKLVFIAGNVCFFYGFLAMRFFGYGVDTAFLFGAILVSSSVGEIIPIVSSTPHIKDKLGNIIIPAVVILDTVSLILLSFVLHFDEGPMSIVFFMSLALFFIILSVRLIPLIAKWYFGRYKRRPADAETTFVLAILFYFIAVATLLGIHGIVAAFIAGIILGEIFEDKGTLRKLEAIGHGILIPIFFINLGIATNLGILVQDGEYKNILMAVTVLMILILSKLIGGLIFALTSKRSTSIGLTVGLIFWPQLSATLAATEVGKEAGIIPDELFVSIVVMAIVSALGTPFVVRALFGRRSQEVHFEDHIIIIGSGKTGAEVIDSLLLTEEDFLVVDNDLDAIKEMRLKWVSTIYGDATDEKILRNAGIEKAKMVVATLPQGRELGIVIKRVKEINPECKIIARVHGKREMDRFKEDVDVFIHPEKVTAFNLVWQTHRLLEGDTDTECLIIDEESFPHVEKRRAMEKM